MAEPSAKTNFIEAAIDEAIASGLDPAKLQTRFPPEPNGYLHIGHAKSICLNFGLALKYGGRCNLRFDDTNPTKEEQEYVDSIRSDVSWLGFSWDDREYYASDYFDQLYGFAEDLIQKGLAYVDDQSADQIRETRGTLTEPGVESPYRNRPVQENLDIFRRMRAGEFPDGSRVLRAKVDMASGNINMRDPVMYRILRATHHRTGDKWCIYPMYDWAHGQSDSIERVTHSICTMEFEDHRPLYDWFLENLGIHRPRQMEFARLNLSHTVLSKRKLIRLVKEGHVRGWDDPRLPTISGMRRRGYTAESIRDFCDRIGVAKALSTVDIALLEHCLRQDLNMRATRVMAVLRPLKVVIEDYPEGRSETLVAENNPEDASAGTREITLSREIYIEQDDFMENPPGKFFRLAPGREVRLKHAFIVKCVGVDKDSAGNIVTVRCTHDPESRSGMPGADRRVKGTLHWVDAATALNAEVRLYGHMFTSADPEQSGDFTRAIDPASLETLAGCKVEPVLATATPGQPYQFLRMGYFAPDPDGTPDRPVFNRTATLRDTWARIAATGKG